MKITNNWFYQDTPFLVKTFLLTFIWGDAIIMFPLITAILILFIYNHNIGINTYIFLFAFRYFVEIFYWLHQQFGPKTYRPYDFGLKNLDNNSIYILYQLFSMAMVILSSLALLLNITKMPLL